MISEVAISQLMAQSGVAFGTSGARGLVSAMTDRVCSGYARGFLQYLASIGGFEPGRKVALAGDLRPSTPRIVAACAQGVRDAGGVPVFFGLVPTPTLACRAFAAGIPSIMVTGSHIPADRNGIKFYRPDGEVLKSDEAGMAMQTIAFDDALFSAEGNFLTPPPLPPVDDDEAAYLGRYRDFFGNQALSGKRIGIYQHSAVGRDLVTRIVAALGADVIPLGRSETFVPVDTEAIRAEDVALARQWAAEYGLDAIVSTDGDSDRPLLADESGRWLRGDVLGVLCARALGIDHVVTPVSSNTVLELCGAFPATTRTRIGSPYVIAGMNAALANGAATVAGYEANGGFLLGSDLDRDGRRLTALPTRDAVLPVLAVLVAAGARPLSSLEGDLPARFTHSDRLTPCPPDQSRVLFAHLGTGDAAAQHTRMGDYFAELLGQAVNLDVTDGFRLTGANGGIIHLRGSGNAPELRCYTEADSAAKAADLNHAALRIVRETILPVIF